MTLTILRADAQRVHGDARILFVTVHDHAKVNGNDSTREIFDKCTIHWPDDSGNMIYAFRVAPDAPDKPAALPGNDAGFALSYGTVDAVDTSRLASYITDKDSDGSLKNQPQGHWDEDGAFNRLVSWCDLVDLVRDLKYREEPGSLDRHDFTHMCESDLAWLFWQCSIKQTIGDEVSDEEFDSMPADVWETVSNELYRIANARKSQSAVEAKVREALAPAAQASATQKAAAAPALRYVPIGDLQHAEIVPPKFIVSQIVPSGTVTLLSGHGGTGKSTLALAIGAHVAAEAWAWSGLSLKSGRVVYVSLEDDGDVVRFRLKKIADSYGLDTSSIQRSMLVLDGTECETGLAVELSQSGRKMLGFTKAMQEVISACENARLIIIDNVSDAFDANENDRPLVRAFVKRLTKIARTNNAGLILLAHVDKAGVRNGSNGNTFSGSTAWHNSARSRLALHDVGDGLIELRHEKSNFGPKARPLTFRFNDRGIPMPADSAPDTSATTAEDDATLIRCIERAAETSEPIGANRVGPGNTHTRMVTLPSFPPSLKPKNKFWSTIDRLADAGRIARVEYTDARRKTKWKWTVAPVAQVAPVLDN